MKKLVYLLLVLFTIINCAYAAPITVNEALQVAKDFYQQNSGQVIKIATLAHIETSATDDAVLFYVFNINENGGYVIVPATDNQHVMGFSKYGQYVPKHGVNVSDPSTSSLVVINRWDASAWATVTKS